MNFKKTKREVIQEAQSAAWTAANNQISSCVSNLKYNMMGNSNNSNLDFLCNGISYAISTGIEAAVKSLVENTYTDQEFEEDLKLKT